MRFTTPGAGSAASRWSRHRSSQSRRGPTAPPLKPQDKTRQDDVAGTLCAERPTAGRPRSRWSRRDRRRCAGRWRRPRGHRARCPRPMPLGYKWRTAPALATPAQSPWRMLLQHRASHGFSRNIVERKDLIRMHSVCHIDSACRVSCRSGTMLSIFERAKRDPIGLV